MEHAARIHVTPYNSAGRVNSQRVSGHCARKMDCDERAFVQKKAVMTGWFEAAHNPASRIDPDGLRKSGARRINGCKGSFVENKPVDYGTGICIASDNLAARIDIESLSGYSAGDIDRCERALVEQIAMQRYC